MLGPLADPVRVGLILPYWVFWESSAEDLRSQRETMGMAGAEQLRALGFDVLTHPLIDSETAGREVGTSLLKAAADVVVVMFTMAAPPSHTLAVLDELGEVPVILWTLQHDGSANDQDVAGIVMDGGTVGTPMVTNVLVRSDRRFGLVVGAVNDAATMRTLEAELRAGAVARRLAGARIARIGDPVPGYLCVDADDDDLERALGVQVIRIDAAELQRRSQDTRGGAAEASVRGEVAELFDVAKDLVDTEALATSMRLAAALRTIDDEYGLAAGTVNCHVPELRYAQDPGVTPCFALGRETSSGIPWTCTGDVLTAIAMLVTRALSGAALYHEIERIDLETGECLLANSGEHDLAWRPSGSTPRLRANPWFRRDERCGACAWHPLPPGSATLVAFTAHHAEPSGFRFIVAEGDITQRRLDSSPTVGGAFRFKDSSDGVAEWHRWVLAGANHHDALGMGHIAGQIEAVCRWLGVGVELVT